MSSSAPQLDDEWLDALEGAPQQRTPWQVVQDTFTGPARWARRISVFAATTPGQIIAMMLVLTLSLAAAGFSMSQSMASRQRALDTLITSTEPMANSAHLLYSSLSQADTVSTTSFVQPGLLTQEQLGTYLASIDRAAVTAGDILEGTVATVGSSFGSAAPSGQDADAVRAEISSLVTEILRDLPMYTAIMERAKVNQRMGNPVGIAYMTEASSVMREQMLKNAEDLSSLTQDEVAAEVQRLSSPQWVPLSGLVAALVFLIIAQWWLWRAFRRRLNKGFIAATAAIIVAICWVGVSNFQSWQNGVVGFERAAEPWQRLADSRIDAQESRTDETLALLSRQSVSRSSQSFELTYLHVTQALDATEELGGPTISEATVASARQALEDWASAHQELVSALSDGRFEHAINLLNATEGADGRPGSAAAFRQLEDDLQELINQTRENTRVHINASLDATRLVSGAVAGLSAFAVVCIWIGIRRRLGEYM
ncbi:hypothetical protein M5J20_05430 [Corynebacterium sp. TA-R-1]|uniref:Chemotaxis methyl-accepting receptor HlyB-like 4HB MCP domain-containing protein n=1 Tax=Corynebacterium stercoris TaxID=2943490 RepID=A0ABT1G0S3_9CORY|nr:hypothetical protein [Corynebacterium stercoris]